MQGGKKIRESTLITGFGHALPLGHTLSYTYMYVGYYQPSHVHVAMAA